MNEVLFTKGDISGAEHLKPLIDHRCNCVLVHPGGSSSPCHSGAHTKDGQSRAIKHLLYWEGREALLQYVDMMSQYMKSDQAEKARNLILMEA